MTQWKLILAYDGTPFRGWQVQPGLPTVQGMLADAIHRTLGERVLPQGSGRTDAGVHALGQVASFALAAPIPAANLHNALNRCLPPSIRILSAEIALPDFHARHSALRKTYEYRIFPLKSGTTPYSVPHPSPYRGEEIKHSIHLDPICPPILASYVWPCPWPLDLAALNQAAAHVIGSHDFTTFAASDPDLTTRKSAKDAPSPPPGNSNLLAWAFRSKEEMALEHTEKGNLGAEKRRNHIPGAKALDHSEAGMPGLKSRPNSETSFSAVMPGLRSRPISETSFSAATLAPRVCCPAEPPASFTNVRTITHSGWHTQDALLIYRVTATGFLHHMVRNLVGTFVQCGAHRLPPDSIPTLLDARDRSAAGPTAPPTGLFLLNVEYLEPSTSNPEPEL